MSKTCAHILLKPFGGGVLSFRVGFNYTNEMRLWAHCGINRILIVFYFPARQTPSVNATFQFVDVFYEICEFSYKRIIIVLFQRV